MRYWLLVGKNTIGPLEPRELVQAIGFAPESLVCPENMPRQSRRNWKSARQFKDIAVLLEPRPRRPPALASAPAAVEAARSRPETTASRKRKPLSTPWAPAALLFLSLILIVWRGAPRETLMFGNSRAVPFQTMMDHGGPLDLREADALRKSLEELNCPAHGKTLGQEMGATARWRIQRLLNRHFGIEIRSSYSHPMTGRRYVCRVIYDPKTKTVKAANELAKFLLGSEEPVPINP